MRDACLIFKLLLIGWMGELFEVTAARILKKSDFRGLRKRREAGMGFRVILISAQRIHPVWCNS